MRDSLPGLGKVLDQVMDAREAGKLDDLTPNGRFKRVQHPSAWGCVPAKLEILKVNSSEQFGVFRQEGGFDAIIRLSKNAFVPDYAPKTTSIAVKAFGVKGKRAPIQERDSALQDANKDTFDLIMVGTPTLPVFAIPGELALLHGFLLRKQFLQAGWYFLSKRPTLIPRLAKVLWTGLITSNPFLIRHYAIQPSKLGIKEGLPAIRYGLFPCDESEKQEPAPQPKTQYIAEVMEHYLQQKEACMKLMIQKQADPCIDQVDDNLSNWSGAWHHVGYLRVSKGSRPVSDDKCDDLAFNPFHAPVENIPVGWVARMRREIYAMQSARRYEKNRQSHG